MGFLLSFFSLELLHGGQEGCLTWQPYCQNSNLAQRNFLKHQSRIYAKGTIFMLVPTAVCYLIFKLAEFITSKWSVECQQLESTIDLPPTYTHFCTCVALACALSWLILVLQLFQALITPKRRGHIQKKLPFKNGGKGHFCISFPDTLICNISHPRWQRRRSMSHANIMRQANQQHLCYNSKYKREVVVLQPLSGFKRN